MYNGSVLQDAVKCLEVGGRDVTDYLKKLLNKRGYPSLHRETVRDVKEKLCYVAMDCEFEMECERNYELPDGQMITVGTERFGCSEGLLRPALIGKNSDEGIHKLVYESIMKCDVDIRRALYSNTVLSGGTSLFPSMTERLAM